jgi:RimJ/RimL family protein N-acetyltransferase
MIEGKLVNLRTLEMDDLERNVEWFNDREVTRYISMRYPLPRAAEEEWIKGQVASFQSYGPLFYAIETKDGTYIGNINFHIVFPESRKARLGITIGDKAHWSKGYGTDAMLTMLRVGFDDMNLNRIDLTVDEDNARAIACYEKCGFVHEGRMRQSRYTRGRYSDQLVMGILRDEFYAMSGALTI